MQNIVYLIYWNEVNHGRAGGPTSSTLEDEEGTWLLCWYRFVSLPD